MTLPLTGVQERLWRFVQSCDTSPSFDEIREACGFKSKSQVHAVVKALELKGFIRRLNYRARSIIAIDPQTDLIGVKTVSLLAELERRGVILAVPA